MECSKFVPLVCCILSLVLVLIILMLDVLRGGASGWRWGDSFLPVHLFADTPRDDSRLRTNSSSLVSFKPPAAMCLFGGVRTFISPKVANSLSQLLANMELGGLVSGDRPDLFAYLSVADAGPKPQRGWRFTYRAVARDDVEKLLLGFGFVAFRLVDDAGEVTAANIDSYVLNREACFAYGWWKRADMLVRSMSQLAKAQHCLDLVLEHEQRHRLRYRFVMVARPDLLYRGVRINMSSALHEGAVLYQEDWWFAMPRSLMLNILDPSRARPLTCTPGAKCCGQPWDSEVMWEYLLGVELKVGRYRSKVPLPPPSKYFSKYECFADIARESNVRTCMCQIPEIVRQFCR